MTTCVQCGKPVPRERARYRAITCSPLCMSRYKHDRYREQERAEQRVRNRGRERDHRAERLNAKKTGRKNRLHVSPEQDGRRNPWGVRETD